MLVQTISKCLKLVLWHLLWPFAAVFDLVRDRTHEKPGWYVAMCLGGYLLFLLICVLIYAWPESQKWTLFVFIAVAYLAAGNGFRSDVQKQNLWEL